MYISQGQEQVDHITNEVKHNIEERCSTMKFGLDALATGHCVTLNEHLEQNLENVRKEAGNVLFDHPHQDKALEQRATSSFMFLLEWSGPVCLIMIMIF